MKKQSPTSAGQRGQGGVPQSNQHSEDNTASRVAQFQLWNGVSHKAPDGSIFVTFFEDAVAAQHFATATTPLPIRTELNAWPACLPPAPHDECGDKLCSVCRSPDIQTISYRIVSEPPFVVSTRFQLCGPCREGAGRDKQKAKKVARAIAPGAPGTVTTLVEPDAPSSLLLPDRCSLGDIRRLLSVVGEAA